MATVWEILDVEVHGVAAEMEFDALDLEAEAEAEAEEEVDEWVEEPVEGAAGAEANKGPAAEPLAEAEGAAGEPMAPSEGGVYQ